MRAPASFLVLCFGLTTACAAPPKPAAVTPTTTTMTTRSALAARAPATTRVLFHLAFPREGEAVNSWMNRKLAGALGLCALDEVHDLAGIEGWVTESGEARAEVTGTLSLKKVACLAAALGVAVDEGTTPLALGPFHVTERAGGLVLSTAGAVDERGAPAALAQRFDAMIAAGADLVVATNVGTPPFEATARMHGTDTAYELRVGRDQAASAAALIATLLGRSQDPRVKGVMVTAADERLVLHVESTPELAFALRREVVEAFNLPNGSMSPTMLLGDHFFLVKDVPARAPARGEVVVFEYKDGVNMVARVVGLPGDHLVTQGDIITVNGAAVPSVPVGEIVLDAPQDGKPPVRGAGFRETLGEHTYTVIRSEDPSDETQSVDVPAGQVFVVGDNRHNSFDSRHFGAIPFARIRGRAAVIHWSMGAKGIRWERVLQPVE